MQIGWRNSTPTPRIALMESRKPVCWMSVSARWSQCQARGDADAFVLLADADEREGSVARNGPQQSAARDDVGHREDELYPARLDRRDDGRAFELACVTFRSHQIRIHRLPHVRLR